MPFAVLPLLLANAERRAAREQADRVFKQSTCGTPWTPECARGYRVEELNATPWARDSPESERLLRQRHAAARRECATALVAGGGGGGWCYSWRAASARPAPERVVLPHNRSSYDLPWGHTRADEGFVGALADIVEATTPPAHRTLNDFGAGVGQYGRSLQSRSPSLRWRGWDGAGDVEQFTDGLVGYFDLTIPLALPRAQWVMSLEVGEPVPRAFEPVVLRNLHVHACRGVILSWAAPSAKGVGHVNNHGAEYLADVFVALGYTRNARFEAQLRRAVRTSPWLRRTMVWERVHPVAEGEC